jgi:hypothetical protein
VETDAAVEKIVCYVTANATQAYHAQINKFQSLSLNLLYVHKNGLNNLLFL